MLPALMTVTLGLGMGPPMKANGVTDQVRPVLLIHIEKSGGDSILATLGLDGTNGSTACQGVPGIVTKHGKHDVASTAKSYYTDEEWANAYKMAFVRNPWDRLVSAWAMVMGQFSVADGAFVPGDDLGFMPELGSAYFNIAAKSCVVCSTPSSATSSASNTLQPSTDGSVHAASSVFPGEEDYPCTLEQYATQCLGPMVNHTQLDFVMNEGEAETADLTALRQKAFLVDFIGRVEALDSHLALALIAAGNPPELANACAATLINDDHGSSHGPYQDYYTSSESIDVSFMRRDAISFNYRFNVSGPMDVYYSS